MKRLDYKFLAIFIAFFSLSATADNPGDADVASTNNVETVEVSETVAADDSALTSAVDAGDGDIENVVTTGSKFEVSQYKTAQPITVITAEEIKTRGYTNAASAVFDLPSVFATTSTGGNQSGLVAGQRIANNFGLGSGRTLTLIDGRRFISSQPIASGGSASTGAVDLNNIPTALIKRIEVQSAGGSAVYGSDAIAGVINYVIDREYSGFEIDYDYSKPYFGDSDDVEGNQSIALTFGGQFDDGKGNLVVSLQHDTQKDIYYGQIDGYRDCERRVISTRTFAAGKTYQNGYYDSSMTLPYGTEGVTQGEVGMCTVLDYLPFEGAPMDPRYFSTRLVNNNLGAYEPYQIFDADGNIVPYTRGTYYGSGFFRIGGSLLASNNAQVERAALERNNLAVYLTYDISENTKLKIDLYNNSQTSSEVGEGTGGPYLYDGFGGDLDGGYMNYPFLRCDSPFFSASASTYCNTLWPASTAAANKGMLVRKTIRDLYDDPRGPIEKGDTDVESVFIGFEGNVEIIGAPLDWEVGFSTAEATSTGTGQDIIRERMVTAIDVGINPATGEIDCKMNYVDDYLGLTVGAANPYDSARYWPTGFGSAGLPGDCIPYNPLGYNPNNPAADYIMAYTTDGFRNTQDILFGELSGTLAKLPAGDVLFSYGIEQREESLQFIGSTIQNLKLNRSAPRDSNLRSYDTNESYLELSIPLVSPEMGLTYKGWGILELRVDASQRDIDNSITGEYSVEATNLYWQVSDSFAIRGGTQTAVRTPDLYSIYSPASVTYSSAADPCDYRNIGGGVDPQQRLANCQAEPWWTPTFDSKIVNRTAQGTSGGNPNLLNELGDTETIGFIFQPNFDLLPGNFSLSVDLVAIDIADTVESYSLSQNMAGCYDYAVQEDKFCNTFTRLTDPADVDSNNALGDVIDFLSAVNNVGVRKFETFVINLDYGLDTNMGYFTYRFRGYNQQNFESAPTGNPDDLKDFTGQYNEPEWIYDMVLGLNKNNWGVYYNVDGQTGGSINKFQDMENQADKYIDLNGQVITQFDGYWTDSVSVVYNPSESTSMTFNLSNPFNMDGTESRFQAERGFRLFQTLSLGVRHKF